MRFKILVFGAVLLCHAVGHAGTLPTEPELDNGEYMLDLVTNRFSRLWREVWDAGDNRFRLRFGSNSFEQWLLEEELKLSTDLASRLRFRFNHARLFRNSSEQIADDTFEFEGRVYGNNYLSIFATPTFFKAENSIGFMVQNRRAVNRYSIAFVEFPQFIRNFTERRKGGPDTLLTVFTDKPVRFGLDIRERLGPAVWLRLVGDYIPSFHMQDEIESTGQVIAQETIKASGIGGWVEYVWRDDRPPDAQTALGFEGGYRSEESTRTFFGGTGVPAIIPGTLDPAHDEDTRLPPLQRAPRPARDDHTGLSSLQRAPRLREMEFHDDLFDRGTDDSVRFWREERARAQPYVWVHLNRRFTLRATVRFEQRTIEWQSVTGQQHLLEIGTIVPTFGLRAHFGSRRQSIVESGFASEFRKRHEEIKNSLDRTDYLDDHRFYFSFEYAFAEDKRFRITESLELDGEDVGEFRIHDHGFAQMIFSF
jgi:hypothetical protein